MRPGEHNQGFRVENPVALCKSRGQVGLLTGLLRKVPACTLKHPRRESSSSTWPTARTSARPPETDSNRIDVQTAETDHRPANALLIRPDAPITWAATHRRTDRRRQGRAARGAHLLVRTPLKSS
jgi:hypothetical protein